MITDPKFGRWSSDDVSPADTMLHPRRLRGEPEHIIRASQRAAATRQRKLEVKLQTSREKMASPPPSHCSLCGADCPVPFDRNAHDNPEERRKWLGWIMRHFYKCSDCESAGRTLDSRTKYCIRCGIMFEREADQSKQSWAWQGRCPSCRSGG
jgi:hypothetical protein